MDRDLEILREWGKITLGHYVSSMELFKIFSRLGRNLKSRDVCALLYEKIFEILTRGRSLAIKIQYTNPCEDEPVYLEHWNQISLLYSILQRIIKICSFAVFATSDDVSKVNNDEIFMIVHFFASESRS